MVLSSFLALGQIKTCEEFLKTWGKKNKDFYSLPIFSIYKEKYHTEYFKISWKWEIWIVFSKISTYYLYYPNFHCHHWIFAWSSSWGIYLIAGIHSYLCIFTCHCYLLYFLFFSESVWEITIFNTAEITYIATVILLKFSFSRQLGVFCLFYISTVAHLISVCLLFKEEEREKEWQRPRIGHTQLIITKK